MNSANLAFSMVLCSYMATPRKVYKRKGITHVPYEGACYAPSENRTAYEIGERVRVSIQDDRLVRR